MVVNLAEIFIHKFGIRAINPEQQLTLHLITRCINILLQRNNVLLPLNSATLARKAICRENLLKMVKMTGKTKLINF